MFKSYGAVLSDAVTPRIRNPRHGKGCHGWCFDIRLQEPHCIDGDHTHEIVNWMVLESGVWLSDEAKSFQAGIAEVEGDMRLSGKQFTRINYWDNFGSTLPVVVTTVNSFHGSNWVKTRQQQGNNQYFLCALEEAGSAPDVNGSKTGDMGKGTQGHTNVEKVGWVAFEKAIGNIGTRDYEVDMVSGVTHKPRVITFGSKFHTSPPRFFAAMQSYRGTDSAQLRVASPTTVNKGSIMVEEETCSDAETKHVPELVGFIAIEPKSNLIHAQSKFDLGCQGIQDATMAVIHGPNLAVHKATAGGRDSILDYIHPYDDSAEWTFKSCSGGHYNIHFGYALGCDMQKTACDRPMKVEVNGKTVDGFASFPGTGSWSTIAEISVPARLVTGTNTVKLTAIGYSGPDVNYCAVSSLGSSLLGETKTIGEAGTVTTTDYRLTPNVSIARLCSCRE